MYPPLNLRRGSPDHKRRERAATLAGLAPSMLGDRNSGDTTVRDAVPGAAIATVAPLAEGITGRGRVRHFAERIFSLKLGKNKAMATPAGGRGGGGGSGGGGKGRYDRTFEEEHSCKQPLLVKVWLAID